MANIKPMLNSELLFFCTMCRHKSVDEIAKIRCTIPHSTRHYKRGEQIAYQGDKISHLFILTKGRVKTEIVSDSGLTLPMENISAPYPLAAAFLFADNNRFPVDIIAQEECEVILINKPSVEKQMMQCAGFMRGFMAFSANRMQIISERLKIFAQKGIKGKIVYYILSKEVKGTFEFDKSLADLSEYFGVERPSLSRAISEMIRDNIITFKSGRGTIINYNSLGDLLK